MSITVTENGNEHTKNYKQMIIISKYLQLLVSMSDILYVVYILLQYFIFFRIFLCYSWWRSSGWNDRIPNYFFYHYLSSRISYVFNTRNYKAIENVSFLFYCEWNRWNPNIVPAEALFKCQQWVPSWMHECFRYCTTPEKTFCYNQYTVLYSHIFLFILSIAWDRY